MVAVPFVYFMLLFYHYYRKAGSKIDMACFIVLIFATSAFFTILIDVFQLRSSQTWNYQISFGATFIYCALITLCTIPISKYTSSCIITAHPLKSTQILEILAWIAFLYFIFDLVMSFDSLVRILNGDLGEIREAHYRGDNETSWMSRIPPFARAPFSLLNYIFGCFWILQFLGFFCLYVQKMPPKYSVLYILASSRFIIGNIYAAGRSAVMYWLIGIGACYIFFGFLMSKEQKRRIIISMIPLLLLAVAYIVAVTMSRFGEIRNGGVSGFQGGLIGYMGQPFLNFSYFWDNFTSPYTFWQNVLPVTNNIILSDPVRGGVQVQEVLTMWTGFDLGVFYSFIGQIQTAVGKIPAILYCVIVFFLSNIYLKRTKRFGLTITNGFYYMLFSSVLFLGLFGHYYVSAIDVVSVITFSFILHIIE